MSPATDASSDARDPGEAINLDAIEQDLAGVDRALERLEDGTYWTDEVTGQPLDAAHLGAHPTSRRNPA